MQRITPCLWFDDNAEEAVKFYTSIFKNSSITGVSHYGEDGAKASGRPKGTVLTTPVATSKYPTYGQVKIPRATVGNKLLTTVQRSKLILFSSRNFLPVFRFEVLAS